MRTPSTLLRRIATSLMLLALAAFAVNVTAVPTNAFGGPVEHLEYAGPQHAHMHGNGTVHSHTVAVQVDEADWPAFPPLDAPDDHRHPTSDCSGMTHSVALVAEIITAPSLPIATAAMIPSE